MRRAGGACRGWRRQVYRVNFLEQRREEGGFSAGNGCRGIVTCYSESPLRPRPRVRALAAGGGDAVPVAPEFAVVGPSLPVSPRALSSNSILSALMAKSRYLRWSAFKVSGSMATNLSS